MMKLLQRLRNLTRRPAHGATCIHPQPLSVMMTDQPHIFLDLPNLIKGEGTSPAEAQALLRDHLPLIDRGALKIWGVLPTLRYASSLETIHDSIHETLSAYGYTVEVASAKLSDTMQIERASKLDDYLLSREVKRRVREGARELLIVSGDRDFERLATDLAVYGAKLHYTQRQRFKAQRTSKLTRHESLSEFSAPLEHDLERMLSEASQTRAHSAHESGRLILKHEGRADREVELFSGFKVGRNSERAGVVDLCLSLYDRERDYSRQLAEINLLGSSWVLWRVPQPPAKIKRQPIHYITRDQAPTPIGSGESVILKPGDRLSFDHCGLVVEFDR